MHQLLNHFADKRELLPRSLSEIYENLQQFYVLEKDGAIVGTCALYVTWENLAEIKALAVAESEQKKGYGRLLLEACMNDAEKLDIPRLFTLTLQTGFFERFGFKNVSKENLPQKVWTECVRCIYFPDKCVEYAMIKDLKPVAPSKPASLFKALPLLPDGSFIPSEPFHS